MDVHFGASKYTVIFRPGFVRRTFPLAIPPHETRRVGVTGGSHTNSSEDQVYFSAYWQASDERLLMEHVLPTEAGLVRAGLEGAELVATSN